VANRKQRRAGQKKSARSEKGFDRRTGAPHPVLANAMRLYQNGRFAEAERFCEQYLAASPHDPHALYLLGMSAIETGRQAVAESAFADALAQRPGEPAFHNGLALLRARQQRFREALISHDSALALDPRDNGALLGRAFALVELGDLVVAARTLHEASALAPRSPEICRNLGAVLAELGRFDEAAEAYERLIALDPNSAEAHLDLGRVLANLGRPEPAMRCLERALALEPGLARARLLIVDLLCDLGRPQEALRHGIAGMDVGSVSRDRLFPFIRAVARVSPADRDPEIAHGIERCFESSELEYDDLAKPAARQFRATHGVDTAPQRMAEEAVQRAIREQALPPVLGDKLLRLLLTKTVNRDLVLEMFLTAARRSFARAESLPATTIPFLAALALQCFNNGYVFALDDDEAAQLDRLKSALEAELRQAVDPTPEAEARLLRYALYAPLIALECAPLLARIAPHRWSVDFRAVLDRTLLEPMEEQALAPGIPSLGTIENPTSLRVGAQYEEHPYPRWFAPPRPVPERLKTALQRKLPHAHLPDYLDEKVEILVAGAGTGYQPISTALLLRDIEVLAVDLSRASLAYAQRMAIKLGVSNIHFLQADLLRLGELGRQFAVIEAVGVLHHLESPMAGWRVLVSLLRSGGLMRVGLYSALARGEVVAARERIAALGLKPVPEDIRRFRERVLVGVEATDFPRLAHSKDIHDLNGCRDLLFHACEHRFTLPELQAMLAELNLEFLGFEDLTQPVARYYRATFPGDLAMTDLTNWTRFEDAHRDAFPMYVFWCAKR